MALVGDKSDRLYSMNLGDEITQRVEDFTSRDEALRINLYSSKNIQWCLAENGDQYGDVG